MTTPTKKTGAANGHFWGQSARDWADIQEGQFKPGYVVALDHAGVGKGTLYLDAGCGAGMAAQLAAGRGADVHGIDASDPLLTIARERVPQGDFQVADLESLPFPDASFDVVTGFNAFQFAGNPVTALAEARRVTKPAGRVVVMTWGDPKGMEAASLLGALKHLMPPAPPGAPGPFSLSDPTRLRAFAAEAGLTPVDVIDVDSPWGYPDEATALSGLRSSGLSARVIEMHGQQALDEANAAAIAPFRQPDGTYRIGARCRILIAQAE